MSSDYSYAPSSSSSTSSPTPPQSPDYSYIPHHQRPYVGRHSSSDSISSTSSSVSSTSSLSYYPPILPLPSSFTRTAAPLSPLPPPPPPPPQPAPAHQPPQPQPHPVPHQKRSSRRYACHCGKSFTTSGHLARHTRIHTGEKNYQCPEPACGARFSRQDNCMQHFRTHQSPASKRGIGSSSGSGSSGRKRASAGAHALDALANVAISEGRV